jgi:hypothetical protein
LINDINFSLAIVENDYEVRGGTMLGRLITDLLPGSQSGGERLASAHYHNSGAAP